MLFKLNPSGVVTQTCAFVFCKQDTQQHFAQRWYIGFIQACLLTRGGKITDPNLIKCIDFGWIKSSTSVRTIEWCLTDEHKTHSTAFLFNDVSVQQRSYSPGTTGLWTWDLTVLRKHPSFFSVSTLVARPKSPKQGEHKHRNKHVKISNTNKTVVR